jgi:hypothetical protein
VERVRGLKGYRYPHDDPRPSWGAFRPVVEVAALYGLYAGLATATAVLAIGVCLTGRRSRRDSPA